MSEEMKSNLAEDLQRIHRVVTRSLEVAQASGQAFAQTGFPDDATRAGFYNYVHCLSSLLNSHHTGEDEIAFPQVRQRMPGAPVDHLCADHLEMAGILGEIDQWLEKAAAGGGEVEVLAGLNAALGRLSRLWTAHIYLEEEVFSVKKVRESFKLYEQADLSRVMTEYGMKHNSPDYLVVPFVLYNLSEEDRKIMSSSMPSFVTQQLVPVVWKAKWESMKPFLLV